ncbi:complement receptor type 2-like isoform X2 [Acipenser ruthenus]|uniref:complement receptor type 2-like isoform X2 n=1 Tax=Acipenser ruthenus TaxID=7906 RepID=UPI0027428430|nr:complement receptor type 2-like isoform X2 [Acipenser ruthenus]
MPGLNKHSADNVFMISLCLGLALLIVSVTGQCGYPPDYETAILKNKHQIQGPSDFVEGFKVTYKCRSGYVPETGSPTITCTNSQWSQLTLVCERRSCGSPGEILNGHFNTDEGVLFGDKAYAVCDEGFQLAGSGVRSCRAAGWDSAIPICEIVRCPNPLEIVNGEITNPPHRTVTFGTVIIYKCNEGVLVGNRELVCTIDGNYSSAPPACKEHKGCPSVQVENGYKTAGFGPVNNYGDSITFACNPGYILNGTDTVTCGKNEIWEPELPTCQKAPTTTTTTTTTTEVPPTPSPAPTTTTTTTTTTEVPPTPSPAQCGSPPAYPNVIIITQPPLDVEGSTITYACQSGYVRKSGSPTITCTNSQWSNLTLVCERRSCGSPGEILNGHFNTDEGVLFGDKAYAVCDEGFQLVGSGVRNCVATGWDGDIPICEIVKCPNPPEIVNGEITNPPQGTVTFGTSITYKCNKGILVGNRELVCTKDGNYSSAPPACKDHNGCRSVHVENGYKVAGFGPDYNYEDFITFACNPGYILNGTDTVTCGINEIWEPQLPTCQKAPTTNTTTTTTEVPPTPSPAPTTTTTTEVPSTPSPGISSTAGLNTVKTTTTDDKNGPPGRCGKTCGNPLLLLALLLLIKLMPFI